MKDFSFLFNRIEKGINTAQDNFLASYKSVLSLIIKLVLIIVVILIVYNNVEGDNFSEGIFYLLMGWYLVFPLTLFFPALGIGWYFANKMQNVPYVIEDGKAVPGPPGWFTSLPPGIVKIIVRGDTPLYFLMDFMNHKFEGDTSKVSTKPNRISSSGEVIDNETEYDVISGPAKMGDIIPFPKLFSGITIITDWFFIQIRFLWWLWKVLIYKWSGVIFTGIPDWQKVRTYKLEYLKLEEGKLVTKSSYSDQFRVMEFDIYVKVPAVETNDNVMLDVTLHLICRVFNPWLTAFRVPQSEGWYNRISGLLSGETRNYYRGVTYQETLSQKTALVDKIKPLGIRKNKEGAITKIGIEIVSASVYNQSVVDPELMGALSAVAKATANSSSRKIDADAEAYANTSISDTMSNPDARTVYEHEATIRAIKAAPRGAIITIDTTGGNNGNNDSTILKGILAETRKNAEAGRNTQPDKEV